MKRMWIGVVLLVAFCAAGIVTAVSMNNIHTPISQALLRASDAALQENWEQASLHFYAAREKWETSRRFTATVADHVPMDEIDSLFAELAVYLQAQESPHFSATCFHLAALTRAMGDAHAINWWNLLQHCPMIAL